MTSNPIAIGRDTVSRRNASSMSAAPGKKYPMATPNVMAMKIHSVRNLSRNVSRVWD